jgi:hypothetical protein
MKGKAVRVHPAQVQGYEAGVGRLELTALAEDFVWQDGMCFIRKKEPTLW